MRRVVVLGLNHRTASVNSRERFAFAEAEIPAALEQLRAQGLAEEAVIVSTCNRVEVYAATTLDPASARKHLQGFLTAWHECHELGENELYFHEEPQSVEHLFKVASGLDSMVVGETEILGQLKKAYEVALRSGHTGGTLNKAFQRAFNVAKHIRTETNIQRGTVSVSYVAVELAERIFDTVKGRRVMVLGAGDTSEKAARALVSRGATDLVVSNRSLDRAQALAQALGGRAVPFDQWEGEFDELDILISSTSAPHYVLDRPRLEPLMRRRRHRPLLLIDIAVPRDIDPAVNELENVYLYNIDDLQSIADSYLQQRLEEMARCEKIIAERARSLLAERRERP